MKKYILKRFLQLIPVLIGITFLSFAMMRIAGSDAVMELYGDKGAVAQEIIEAKAGCTIFCHCGPGTLGVIFLRKA